MVSTSYADIFATFTLACRIAPRYARNLGGSGLSCVIEHLRQPLAMDSVVLGLAYLMEHYRAFFAARLAAAALLLRFEVGELAWLHVTGISRFRKRPTALG